MFHQKSYFGAHFAQIKVKVKYLQIKVVSSYMLIWFNFV